MFLFEFVKDRYKEIEINKNNIFQTTGKTKLGGVKFGLIDWYHSVLVFGPVNKLPKNPIRKTEIIEIINIL